MLKIFTTQLIGRLKKIESEQEYALEDGARLLAQALVGDGDIYIYAEQEMAGILSESMNGQEPLHNVKKLTVDLLPTLTSADRVFIFSRFTNEETVVTVANTLYEMHIPFVAVSSIIGKDDNPLEELADIFIPLYMDKGLVPTDTGDRTGFPHLIAALYVYHNVKLLLEEMLEE
ncbi:DUF2529 domain-containing protein [Caldibacillus lycopersici]|uniref:DUF2529 domain-containing protein n=1 Tax=Perspicuibacillus lycopersici TaxID=1325689 RepID=A0AAE3ITT6_9BACI|nr:DUF2529 domain-containing protein [Perspicuibacillus lycopersici]MCU9613324.1 DUF2529 domain-containing protein [Perspicuibacillus lycopersici]